MHICGNTYINISEFLIAESVKMFSTIKIYHNPECGTSRNTLALIQNAGIEPIVIEYLITPPSKAELIELIRSAGLSVREAIRKNVPPYSDLEIVREDWSDEQLLNFMLQHPILINLAQCIFMIMDFIKEYPVSDEQHH